MLLVAIINKRVEPVDTFRNHATAAATIAAIRPTPWHMGFPPEADAARSAIAALDIDFCLIKKFHGCVIFHKKSATLRMRFLWPRQGPVLCSSNSLSLDPIPQPQPPGQHEQNCARHWIC
jgi:hypothetical protein